MGRIFPFVFRFIKEAAAQIASFTLKVRLEEERLSPSSVLDTGGVILSMSRVSFNEEYPAEIEALTGGRSVPPLKGFSNFGLELIGFNRVTTKSTVR